MTTATTPARKRVFRIELPPRSCEYAGQPIGNPPRTFTEAEVAVWNEMLEGNTDWLDAAHRKFLTHVVRNILRIDELEIYFRERCAEFKAAGKSKSDGFMADDGEPHPLMVELLQRERALIDGLWKAQRMVSREVVFENPTGNRYMDIARTGFGIDSMRKIVGV